MRDLSLHLLDIIQNSVKAGALRIEAEFSADPAMNLLTMVVRDNGCGMPPELARRVTDPFVTTRTTRSVGLGLPLLKEQCELTGGRLTLESEVGTGTVLTAELGLDSIDRLPLGEISSTWVVLILADPLIDYRLVMQSPGRRFELGLAEVREQLQEVPLSEPAVLEWIKDYIDEQQENIFGGVLHEIISRTGCDSAESPG